MFSVLYLQLFYKFEFPEILLRKTNKVAMFKYGKRERLQIIKKSWKEWSVGHFIFMQVTYL